MTATAQMLDTYPRDLGHVDRAKLQRCIEACVTRAVLEACAQVCQSGGDICTEHSSMHEHCRVCAESCRTCEQASRDLISSLG